MTQVNVSNEELASILQQTAEHAQPPPAFPLVQIPASVSIIYEIRLPWMSVGRLVLQAAVWVFNLAIIGALLGWSITALAGSSQSTDNLFVGLMIGMSIFCAAAGVILLAKMAKGTPPPGR